MLSGWLSCVCGGFAFAGELAVFKQPEGRAPASQGKAPKYELATHTVRVRRTGSLAEVMALWDLEGTLT